MIQQSIFLFNNNELQKLMSALSLEPCRSISELTLYKTFPGFIVQFIFVISSNAVRLYQIPKFQFRGLNCVEP